VHVWARLLYQLLMLMRGHAACDQSELATHGRKKSSNLSPMTGHVGSLFADVVMNTSGRPVFSAGMPDVTMDSPAAPVQLPPAGQSGSGWSSDEDDIGVTRDYTLPCPSAKAEERAVALVEHCLGEVVSLQHAADQRVDTLLETFGPAVRCSGPGNISGCELASDHKDFMEYAPGDPRGVAAGGTLGAAMGL